MAGFLIATAVVIDSAQWLVGLLSIGIITAVIVWIVNGFVNLIAWLGFYFWFEWLGVSFVSPKKVLTLAGTVVGDTIAGGYLPAWILCVLFILYFEKIENLVARVPGGDKALKAAAAVKMAKKPPVLPTGPTPMPKGPPPLPPRPGEAGYGDVTKTRSLNLNRGIDDFQKKSRTEAATRAEGLRQHEEKYREDIEKEIKEYGAGNGRGTNN
jgi:hypothetical protein